MRVARAVSLPHINVGPDDARLRLASLFDVHEERLYRLARRLSSSADDAEDLVQETFVRAARSLPSVPLGYSKEEAWLVRTLVNLRKDQWRRAGVRKHPAPLVIEDAPLNTANPETRLITKQRVWAALEALPPRRRAIVVLHELEGHAVGEIARLLGVSTVTVQWHLSVGRRELRRLIGGAI
jgi:RNA polymerase sigma-70 factor (ECF subfamily)